MIAAVPADSRLQVLENCLTVNLPADEDGASPAALLDLVTDRVQHSVVNGVILNMRAVDAADSRIVMSIENFIGTLRLLGRPCIVTDIRPECAVSMVELGLMFANSVVIRRTVADGVRALRP